MAIPGLTNTQQAAGVQLGGAITPQTVNAAQQQAQQAQAAAVNDVQLSQSAIEQSARSSDSYYDRVGRTAGFMADAGAALAKNIEQTNLQNQAAILAPMKQLAQTFGYKKIQAGDFSGFNDIAAASSIGAGNPLLARMDAQATVIANGLANRFVNTALATQRQQAAIALQKSGFIDKLAVEDYRNKLTEGRNQEAIKAYADATGQPAPQTTPDPQVSGNGIPDAPVDPSIASEPLQGNAAQQQQQQEYNQGSGQSLQSLNNGAQQEAVDGLPQPETTTEVKPAAPVSKDLTQGTTAEVPQGETTTAPAQAVGSTGDDSIDKALLNEGVNLAKLSPEQRQQLTQNISKTATQLATSPVQLDKSEDMLFAKASWDDDAKLTKQLESLPLTTAARLLGAKAKQDPSFAQKVPGFLKELGVNTPSSHTQALAQLGKYEAGAMQEYNNPGDVKKAMEKNGLNPLPMDDDQAEIFGGNVGFISPKKKGTPVTFSNSLSISNGKATFTQRQNPGKPASDSAGLPSYIQEPAKQLLEATNEIKNNPEVADQIKKAGGLRGSIQPDGSFRPTIFATQDSDGKYTLKTVGEDGKLTEGTPISKDTGEAIVKAQTAYQALITTPSVKAYVFQIANPRARIEEPPKGKPDDPVEAAAFAKKHMERYRAAAQMASATPDQKALFNNAKAAYISSLNLQRDGLQKQLDRLMKHQPEAEGFVSQGTGAVARVSNKAAVEKAKEEAKKITDQMNDLDAKIEAEK